MKNKQQTYQKGFKHVWDNVKQKYAKTKRLCKLEFCIWIKHLTNLDPNKYLQIYTPPHRG